MPDAAAHLIGTQLSGRYEVTAFLARGRIGWVYRGRVLAGSDAGKSVILSFISAETSRDAELMAALQTEVRALASVLNAALAVCYGLEADPKTKVQFLVTEDRDGPPLASTLPRKLMAEPEVRSLVRWLAMALEAAHERGVLHLGIAPEAVVLPGGNLHQAVLTGFLLGARAEMARRDPFAGLAFAAPEQLDPAIGPIGPWTDIYALGLLAVAVARGEPLSMGGPREVALKRRTGVPDLSDIPVGLRPLLSDMLEPDPTRRLQSMAAVPGALSAPGTVAPTPAPGAKRRPDPAKPPAPAPTSPDDDTGGKPPVALIAAVAVAVLAGVGWWFGGGVKPSPDESARYAAAVAALPCSGLTAVPGTGAVTVRGWRRADRPLPPASAGLSVDKTAVAPVAAPSDMACSAYDRLARVAATQRRCCWPKPRLPRSLRRGSAATCRCVRRTPSASPGQRMRHRLPSPSPIDRCRENRPWSSSR
jgi:hypothetical protein